MTDWEAGGGGSEQGRITAGPAASRTRLLNLAGDGEKSTGPGQIVT
jgi:hypothetical protein